MSKGNRFVRIAPWLYIPAWCLWLWWRWNSLPPINVDVPETIRLGQWILTHGRFPVHLHWVWGAPGSRWLAVGWEAGSALLFALADRLGGPGLFALWTFCLTLTLALTALAARRAGYRPSFGALFLAGIGISLFEPLVAAMWVLPGTAFLLWDAAMLLSGRDGWRHRVLYGAVLVAWAWMSPSVLLAPVFTLGLLLLWPRSAAPRPLPSLFLRLLPFPALAVVLLPDPLGWLAAVLRYARGAVVPHVPWPSVTGLLRPFPWPSLPMVLWLLLLLAVAVRGARLRRPGPLWWGLLLPLGLLLWREAYYAGLSFWALSALLVFQGAPEGRTPVLRLLLAAIPPGLALAFLVVARYTPARMAPADFYPQYAWYRTWGRRLPAGRVFVPLAQGGVFTQATGRQSWLDNRMQVWDAYPAFYDRAASLATGRLPLGKWLRQEGVVAVFWPRRPAEDRRLQEAGWHIAARGPGGYRLWLPG